MEYLHHHQSQHINLDIPSANYSQTLITEQSGLQFLHLNYLEV